MFSPKTLERVRPAAVLLLLSALVLGAQPAQKPVGVLRIPPLPDLAQKVNAFGYATDTNQMIQFLALMTLGQVGYPMFPGASRTENAGLVCFDSGIPGEITYALVAKFTPNSSVPAKIKAAGMAVKEVGGWTVIAPEPSALYTINAANIEDVLRLVRKERSFDFEFETTRSPEEMDALRQRLNTPGGTGQLDVNLLFSFLENIQSSLLGVNLDSERLQIGTRQVARSGTPEAALLSAKSGGAVPVARFVPDTGNAGLIYHTDPVAVSDYLQVAFGRLKAAGRDDESAQLHAKLEQTLQTIAEDWDGTGAYSLTFDSERVDYAGVVGGDWEQEPFSQLLDELFADIMPALLDEMPISQYASAVQMATSTSQSVGPVSSALPGALGNVVVGGSLNTLDEYQPPSHQIVDGMIVVSNQPARLEELAAAVGDDETAAQPLSNKLTLSSGQALRAYVDMKALTLRSLERMNLYPTPSTTLAIHNLSAANLEPMAIEIDTGDNTLTGTLTIPIETARALSSTLQQIKQSTSEQTMH